MDYRKRGNEGMDQRERERERKRMKELIREGEAEVVQQQRYHKWGFLPFN